MENAKINQKDKDKHDLVQKLKKLEAQRSIQQEEMKNTQEELRRLEMARSELESLKSTLSMLKHSSGQQRENTVEESQKAQPQNPQSDLTHLLGNALMRIENPHNTKESSAGKQAHTIYRPKSPTQDIPDQKESLDELLHLQEQMAKLSSLHQALSLLSGQLNTLNEQQSVNLNQPPHQEGASHDKNHGNDVLDEELVAELQELQSMLDNLGISTDINSTGDTLYSTSQPPKHLELGPGFQHRDQKGEEELKCSSPEHNAITHRDSDSEYDGSPQKRSIMEEKYFEALQSMSNIFRRPNDIQQSIDGNDSVNTSYTEPTPQKRDHFVQENRLPIPLGQGRLGIPREQFQGNRSGESSEDALKNRSQALCNQDSRKISHDIIVPQQIEKQLNELQDISQQISSLRDSLVHIQGICGTWQRQISNALTSSVESRDSRSTTTSRKKPELTIDPESPPASYDTETKLPSLLDPNRPTTSRRVPHPSPAQFTDYIPPKLTSNAANHSPKARKIIQSLMINRENGIPLENEASPGSTEIFEEVSEGESCDVQASSSQENLEKSSVCRLSDGELEEALKAAITASSSMSQEAQIIFWKSFLNLIQSFNQIDSESHIATHSVQSFQEPLGYQNTRFKKVPDCNISNDTSLPLRLTRQVLNLQHGREDTRGLDQNFHNSHNSQSAVVELDRQLLHSAIESVLSVRPDVGNFLLLVIRELHSMDPAQYLHLRSTLFDHIFGNVACSSSYKYCHKTPEQERNECTRVSDANSAGSLGSSKFPQSPAANYFVRHLTRNPLQSPNLPYPTNLFSARNRSSDRIAQSKSYSGSVNASSIDYAEEVDKQSADSVSSIENPRGKPFITRPTTAGSISTRIQGLMAGRDVATRKHSRPNWGPVTRPPTHVWDVEDKQSRNEQYSVGSHGKYDYAESVVTGESETSFSSMHDPQISKAYKQAKLRVDQVQRKKWRRPNDSNSVSSVSCGSQGKKSSDEPPTCQLDMLNLTVVGDEQDRLERLKEEVELEHELWNHLVRDQELQRFLSAATSRYSAHEMSNPSKSRFASNYVRAGKDKTNQDNEGNAQDDVSADSSIGKYQSSPSALDLVDESMEQYDQRGWKWGLADSEMGGEELAVHDHRSLRMRVDKQIDNVRLSNRQRQYFTGKTEDENIECERFLGGWDDANDRYQKCSHDLSSKHFRTKSRVENHLNLWRLLKTRGQGEEYYGDEETARDYTHEQENHANREEDLEYDESDSTHESDPRHRSLEWQQLRTRYLTQGLGSGRFEVQGEANQVEEDITGEQVYEDVNEQYEDPSENPSENPSEDQYEDAEVENVENEAVDHVFWRLNDETSSISSWQRSESDEDITNTELGASEEKDHIVEQEASTKRGRNWFSSRRSNTQTRIQSGPDLEDIQETESDLEGLGSYADANLVNRFKTKLYSMFHQIVAKSVSKQGEEDHYSRNSGDESDGGFVAHVVLAKSLLHHMWSQVIEVVEDIVSHTDIKMVDRNLQQAIRQTLLKYQDASWVEARHNLIQDLCDLLYDELVFDKLVAQVTKSYQFELKSIATQRDHDIFKLLEERKKRLGLELISKTRKVESPRTKRKSTKSKKYDAQNAEDDCSDCSWVPYENSIVRADGSIEARRENYSVKQKQTTRPEIDRDAENASLSSSSAGDPEIRANLRVRMGLYSLSNPVSRSKNGATSDSNQTNMSNPIVVDALTVGPDGFIDLGPLQAKTPQNLDQVEDDSEASRLTHNEDGSNGKIAWDQLPHKSLPPHLQELLEEEQEEEKKSLLDLMDGAVLASKGHDTEAKSTTNRTSSHSQRPITLEEFHTKIQSMTASAFNAIEQFDNLDGRTSDTHNANPVTNENPKNPVLPKMKPEQAEKIRSNLEVEQKQTEEQMQSLLNLALDPTMDLAVVDCQSDLLPSSHPSTTMSSTLTQTDHLNKVLLEAFQSHVDQYKVSGSQERSGDEWDDETDQNDESDKKEGEDKSNENKSNQSKSDSDSTQEWEVLSCSTEKAPLTLSDKDKTEESGHVIQHTDSVSDKSDEPSEIAIKDDLQESAHTNTTFEDQATNTENNKPVQETKSKKKKGKKRR